MWWNSIYRSISKERILLSNKIMIRSLIILRCQILRFVNNDYRSLKFLLRNNSLYTFHILTYVSVLCLLLEQYV